MNEIGEKQYQEKLIACVKQFSELEKKIQYLEGQIRILEAENDFLTMQNGEYERKLALISNTPFNKAGIKLYHMCNRLRHKR